LAVSLVASRAHLSRAEDIGEWRVLPRVVPVPDRCHASDGPEVAILSDRQAERVRCERALLDRGIRAALDTLFATVEQDLDVTVLVVAAYGDPFAGDPKKHPATWHSVPMHAHFASLRDKRPVSEEQRLYLALEGVRAVSPLLRDELSVAVAILDALEKLKARADSGDDEAARRHEDILSALADGDRAPSDSGEATAPPPTNE
jgi:hypothetical protein